MGTMHRPTRLKKSEDQADNPATVALGAGGRQHLARKTKLSKIFAIMRPSLCIKRFTRHNAPVFMHQEIYPP